ncbi:hydrogenase maturation protease [Massilia sp. DD77]|uniref:hydrogenase maturation protease n=1 Tax=Massilia sp. DD77 TaxID=3109349 RepID=UPI002FFF5981
MRHPLPETRPPAPVARLARVRIIGIGSWCGDDRIGWDAVEALASSGLPRRFPDGMVETCRCEQPGDLLALVRGLPAVVLVDAMRSGAAAGTVRKLAVHELAADQGGLSSHGMDVAQALALGRVLGLLPPVLLLYGVEAPLVAPGTAPDAALCSAMPGLLRRLNRDLRALLGTARRRP